MNEKLLEFVLKSILAFLKVACAPKPKPVPEPVPEPIPVPVPDPEPEPGPKDKRPNEKLYIPWNQRHDWAAKIDEAYSVWRGEREYAALLTNTEIWKDKKFPYDAKTIRQWMEESQEANAKGNRFQHRIKTERHHQFKSRSRVRKSVANDMYGELKLHTARYTAVASFFPIVDDCDAIECKLKNGYLPSWDGEVVE